MITPRKVKLNGRLNIELKTGGGKIFFYSKGKLKEKQDGFVVPLKNGKPYLPSSMRHSQLKPEGITIGYVENGKLHDTGKKFYTAKGGVRRAEIEKYNDIAIESYEKKRSGAIAANALRVKQPTKKAAESRPPRPRAGSFESVLPKQTERRRHSFEVDKGSSKQSRREAINDAMVFNRDAAKDKLKFVEKLRLPKNYRQEPQQTFTHAARNWKATVKNGKLYAQFLDQPKIEFSNVAVPTPSALTKLNRFLNKFNFNKAVIYFDKEGNIRFPSDKMKKTADGTVRVPSKFSVPVMPFQITAGGQLRRLKKWFSLPNITEQVNLEDSINSIKRIEPPKISERKEQLIRAGVGRHDERYEVNEANSQYSFTGSGESLDNALVKLGVAHLPYLEKDKGFYAIYGRASFVVKNRKGFAKKVNLDIAIPKLRDPSDMIKEIADSLRKALTNEGLYFTDIPTLMKYAEEWEAQGGNPDVYTKRIRNIRQQKLAKVSSDMQLFFDMWQVDLLKGTEKQVRASK